MLSSGVALPTSLRVTRRERRPSRRLFLLATLAVSAACGPTSSERAPTIERASWIGSPDPGAPTVVVEKTFVYEIGTRVSLEVLGVEEILVSLDGSELFRGTAEELGGHPALLDLTPRLPASGPKKLSIEARGHRAPAILAALVLKKGLRQERLMTGDGTWALATGGPAVIVEGSLEVFPPPLTPVPRLLMPSGDPRHIAARRADDAWVADLGATSVGFLDVALPAACEGTIETDTMESFAVGGPTILRLGRRHVCREVRISSRGVTEPVEVLFRPMGALGAAAKTFSCSDADLNRIDEAASRAALLCAQAFVEKDPRAARVLEVTTLRPAALTLYSAYGDYRTVRQSLELLAENRASSGSVRALYPFEDDGASLEPSVACAAYVIAVRDYCLYSGDLKLVRQLWPVVERQVELLHDRTDGTRLLRSGARTGIPHVHESEANVLYAGALQASSEISAWLGRTGGPRLHREALAVRDALAKRLADPHTGLLAHEERGDARSQSVAYAGNVLAFLYGIAPSRAALGSLDPLHDLAHPVPFLVDAEAECWLAAGDAGKAFDLLRSAREEPEDLVAPSTLPAYLMRAYVLGIRPTAPGFRRFEVAPHLGTMEIAEGSVATPAGPITVRVERRGKGLLAHVTVPPGLTGTLSPELVAPNAKVDGQPVMPQAGVVTLAGGSTHEIEAP